jgi:hypothetical protein
MCDVSGLVTVPAHSPILLILFLVHWHLRLQFFHATAHLFSNNFPDPLRTNATIVAVEGDNNPHIHPKHAGQQLGYRFIALIVNMPFFLCVQIHSISGFIGDAMNLVQYQKFLHFGTKPLWIFTFSARIYSFSLCPRTKLVFQLQFCNYTWIILTSKKVQILLPSPCDRWPWSTSPAVHCNVRCVWACHSSRALSHPPDPLPRSLSPSPPVLCHGTLVLEQLLRPSLLMPPLLLSKVTTTPTSTQSMWASNPATDSSLW